MDSKHLAKLYVVATPIGNLEDWSHRAESVLKAVDIIICEDTRRTAKLLTRYGIRRPSQSYHDFNEAAKTGQIVQKLGAGNNVALVCDAGTPAVSDPGYRLIRACREQGIQVIPIPGPCAAISALSVSGLPTDQFHFVGFLPPRRLQRRRAIQSLSETRGTLVFYEAPRRIRSTLEDLQDILGNRKVFVAREMTKLHETYSFGTIRKVLSEVKEKGEAVIVLEGSGKTRKEKSPGLDVSTLSRQALLKLAADRLGVSRKELWEALFRKEG